MTSTTPDMQLVLPDVSITAGPQWATLLNNAFNKIDAHDHSLNNGVKVTPSGLNISADLTFNNNNATDFRTVRLYPNNTFTPVAADRNCLYVKSGELYYIDTAGNNVQITINGTIDVANAITTLSIKDSGFFIQYFGDTTRQFRFDASAIPTSTTRILSVPDSGANDSFVTAAATQTLTNKSLTSPTLTTPTIPSYTTVTASAAPTAPAAGNAKLYVSSTDGQLHLLNSAGVDTAIGAGSSTGKNYLQTYYGFTLSPLTGAATSLTATGNRLTNQTVFGTSTATAATLITYNTASPLRAPGDLQITFPAAGSGAFVESPMFTLDSIDANTTTQFISFESSFLTSGAVAGDITVEIVQYDASGNYVGVINPSVTAIPTQYYKFKAAWNPSSTATAKYSIRFIVNTASARTIDIQDIVAGPQFVTESDAVGAWLPYTPTFGSGWGTTTLVSFFYRRVGDSMQIRGRFQAGIVAAASTAISLPTGYTVDTSKINTTVVQSFGQWINLNGSADIPTGGVFGAIAYNGSDNSNMYFSRATASGVYTIAQGTNLNNNLVFDCFNISIPIAQWTSMVTLAGNPNIEYVSNSSSTNADDTSSFAYGSAGSAGVIATTGLTATRLKRVRFSTSIQPTDRLVLEISADRRIWKPWVGYDATLALSSEVNQGTVTYGASLKISSVNNTDVDVSFGNYAAPGTTYASSGTDWVSTGVAYWRVAKYSAVGLAELAPATSTSQGSISRESSWASYVPTVGGCGTVTSNVAMYKVVGDSLIIKGAFVAGTVAASLANITLPSGFTINSAKVVRNVAATATSYAIGSYNTDSGNVSGAMLPYTSTSTSTVYFSGALSGGFQLQGINGSGVFVNGQNVSYQFEVPL